MGLRQFLTTHPATPLYKDSTMDEFDELEDRAACDFCGCLVIFNDEDWTVCANCQAEYTNMDYTSSDDY